MGRLNGIAGILVVSLAVLVSPSFAQTKEHGGQEHGGAATAPGGAEDPGAAATAPEAGTQEHGGAATAPAAGTQEHGGQATTAPAPVTPPALKPITITFSGEVSAVNATDNPPMITVTDRYGVKKEISVPAEAKVAAGAASKSLADLKAGDKVTVEYTYDVATGKRAAQNISIGEATAAGTS